MATSKQLQAFSTIADDGSKPVLAPKLSLNEALHVTESAGVHLEALGVGC
jgi:hypothetical protein